MNIRTSEEIKSDHEKQRASLRDAMLSEKAPSESPPTIFSSMNIKIESNIPAPIVKHKKYPFGDMKIGDSFFVAGKDCDTVRTLACAFQRLNKGYKFTCRRTANPDGIRVWRVVDERLA